MLTRRNFLAAAPATLALLSAKPWSLARAGEPATTLGAPKPPRIGFSSRTAALTGIAPGRVTTAAAKVCRILQLTDLHFFFKTPAEDARTIADNRRLVDRLQPDLVVLSGDLWHDNPGGAGWRGLDQAMTMAASWGVPWTMCWGNHDLLDDYQRGHDQIEAGERSVYRGGGAHGDYRIEIRAAGSDLTAAPALDLFFLNSSNEGLTPWQVNALGQLLRHVGSLRPAPAPALAFFHIPILEYETRISPATLRGIKLEGVGHVNENGEAFPVLAAAKTIRACFCGHNHTNDYTVKAEGVDLVYGRSSGHAGYGGDKVRKGGKLIEVDLVTGVYEARTVFADGSTQVALGWAGERAQRV